MNDIEADDQRDVQARLFDGDFLQVVDSRRVGDKKQRADLAFAYAIFQLDLIGYQAEEELRHLADLFINGHLREQRIDSLIDLRVGERRGLASDGCACGSRLRMNARC